MTAFAAQAEVESDRTSQLEADLPAEGPYEDGAPFTLRGDRVPERKRGLALLAEYGRQPAALGLAGAAIFFVGVWLGGPVAGYPLNPFPISLSRPASIGAAPAPANHGLEYAGGAGLRGYGAEAPATLEQPTGTDGAAGGPIATGAWITPASPQSPASGQPKERAAQSLKPTAFAGATQGSGGPAAGTRAVERPQTPSAPAAVAMKAPAPPRATPSPQERADAIVPPGESHAKASFGDDQALPPEVAAVAGPIAVDPGAAHPVSGTGASAPPGSNFDVWPGGMSLDLEGWSAYGPNGVALRK